MPSKTRTGTGSFIGDIVASASGLLILLFVLVAVDDRVREQLTLFATSGEARATEFAGWGHGLLGLSLVVPQLARLENTHMMIFAVVAIVLVTCLLRL